MLSVAQARARILAAFAPLPAELVPLPEAVGRVLAEEVRARVTQPPFAASAMDGFAVRAEDLAQLPASLEIVGYAPAGGAHSQPLQAGEAVRIFTGAPLPQGADTVVIQENTEAVGNRVLIKEAGAKGSYVRPSGLDFQQGDVGLVPGKRLNARDIGLAGSMNHPWIRVRRKPRVAILATGDEIVMPGEPRSAHQIFSSNGLALGAFLRHAGAEPIDLGIAPDDRATLQHLIAGAAGADLLVTTGGASIGDHDLVQSALGGQGMELDFWKIAMRPGKPLMFGRIGTTPVLGLPGNPVSSLVCAAVFLRPALAAMLGLIETAEEGETAILGRDLPENDSRQDYLRSKLSRDEEGRIVATPFSRQDSSMMFLLQQADCLVIRAPHAIPLAAGGRVPILRLDDI
jgi:molybdopterin molybdotransferase